MMNTKTLCSWAILTALALAAPTLAASEGPDAGASARKYFTDVVLKTHEGNDVRLYSDLLEDKVVVISAFFTTCVGVCPVTAANLQKVQRWLGPRLGEDVLMLSMTVDPETDDLEKLKEYADKVQAKPGWYFITGDKENLELALGKLGLYTEDKEAHSPVFLIGNVRTGLWKKALGMARSKELIEIVDSVLGDRLDTHPEGPAAVPGR
ncbi:MAG: SCO family protein [Thermoanaerobaculia bacterium]